MVTDEPAREDSRYWAFISYSHKDEAWARWLHRSLERYRVPKKVLAEHGDTVPARLVPVFRDREELASGPRLPDRIEAALGAARNLICICSPNAATSRWVDKEIRSYKAMGRADRVFCLIVDGEPNATDSRDLSAEECFPPSIRFEVDPDGELTENRTEPLAADAREGKDGRKDAFLKLTSGLVGVPFEALKQRHEQRRRARRRLFGVTGLVAAAVVAVLVYFATASSGSLRWHVAADETRVTPTADGLGRDVYFRPGEAPPRIEISLTEEAQGARISIGNPVEGISLEPTNEPDRYLLRLPESATDVPEKLHLKATRMGKKVAEGFVHLHPDGDPPVIGGLAIAGDGDAAPLRTRAEVVLRSSAALVTEVRDSSPFTAPALLVRNADGVERRIGGVASDGHRFEFALSTVPEGEFRAQVLVEDRAGNQAESRELVLRIEDDLPWMFARPDEPDGFDPGLVRYGFDVSKPMVLLAVEGADGSALSYDVLHAAGGAAVARGDEGHLLGPGPYVLRVAADVERTGIRVRGRNAAEGDQRVEGKQSLSWVEPEPLTDDDLQRVELSFDGARSPILLDAPGRAVTGPGVPARSLTDLKLLTSPKVIAARLGSRDGARSTGDASGNEPGWSFRNVPLEEGLNALEIVLVDVLNRELPLKVEVPVDTTAPPPPRISGRGLPREGRYEVVLARAAGDAAAIEVRGGEYKGRSWSVPVSGNRLSKDVLRDPFTGWTLFAKDASGNLSAAASFAPVPRPTFEATFEGRREGWTPDDEPRVIFWEKNALQSIPGRLAGQRALGNAYDGSERAGGSAGATLTCPRGGFEGSATLSLWVRCLDTNDRSWIIGHSDKKGEGLRLQLGDLDDKSPGEGKLLLHVPKIGTLSGPIDIPDASGLSQNVWVFFAIVVRPERGGTTVELYRDGAIVGAQHRGGTFAGERLPKRVCVSGFRQKYQFVGGIDDIRIWKQALTRDQISTLYVLGGWPKASD